MAKPATDGCVNPARGVLPAGGTEASDSDAPATPQPEESEMAAHVGHEAPDFEANAYHQGGFKNIKLSDYKGSWIVLCFYPGDFTFV